jgi:hypothetical protein
MRKSSRSILIAAGAAALLAACATPGGGGNSMSFFVTSANPGKGGDLGGLEGADAYCQKLAGAAGAGSKKWRAYLSTSSVDARDRIGKGPWYNVKGEMIAANLDELHGNNKLTKATNLTEKGQMVNGRGDTPNMHDILTGSTADGKYQGASCGDWTSSFDDANAMAGHSDRNGTNPDPVANRSWNASHRTAGCSMEALPRTGSAGLFYCFAAN